MFDLLVFNAVTAIFELIIFNCAGNAFQNSIQVATTVEIKTNTGTGISIVVKTNPNQVQISAFKGIIQFVRITTYVN